jgi:hypothetical protein
VEELAKIPSPPEYVPEVEPTPPSTADLLAGPPGGRVDELLAYEAEYAGRRDQGGLATAIQRAVREKPDWGIELAAALCQRSAWDTALWRSIVSGWNQDGLSTDQWTSVLHLLVDSPQVMSNALGEIVDLLEGRTSADSNPFQGPLLAPAARAGLQAWKALESREEARTEEAGDWLFLAINHAGGQLAQFYLRTLWQAKKDAGNAWRGLTDDFRLYLESVIQGGSWAAELARVVIASGVQTLFVLDLQQARSTGTKTPLLADLNGNRRNPVKLDHRAPDIHTRLRNEAIIGRALGLLPPRDRELLIRLDLKGQPGADIRSEMRNRFVRP